LKKGRIVEMKGGFTLSEKGKLVREKRGRPRRGASGTA